MTFYLCKKDGTKYCKEEVTHFFKYFGNDKKLLILLAEEGNENRGIAPLMYSVHKMFGLRRGKIEFIGTPHSYYINFILVAKENECTKLFIDYLRSFGETWDCIDLIEIPENSISLLHLTTPAKSVRPIHKCHFISFPKTSPGY
jgi:hypothetical protein